MKCFNLIISSLLLAFASKSQISMQTNLPPAVNLNSEVTFEVKINKANYTNFAKFQLELPQDVVVQEVDSKLGSFASEENRVKIIWVIAPSESEFSVKLKLNTGAVAGQKSFVMKYFYMDGDSKKDVEMNPYFVEFKEGLAHSITSDADFVSLSPKAVLPLTTTTISITDLNTKNPEVIKQQVGQLRRDSKDAKVVGDREKAKAEEKVSQADLALANAEKLTDENEKKAALEKATADKKKAEEELEIANRVLLLAKSLDDNANEIETINKSVNPSAYASGGQAAVVSSATTAQNTKTTSGDNSNDDIEKLKSKFESPVVTETVKTNLDNAKSSSKAVSESGLVFKLQLGAFSKEPSKSDFKAIGKIAVKTENGMYKVLYGTFASKEEALKMREQVIAKGFDAFVVSYQDGVRVK
ncbi:MAG: SPOR domain-containing protein [Bacteroidia bacterium]|nr:SPOR domain-containing protein [Bacteroidia bacterium]